MENDYMADNTSIDASGIDNYVVNDDVSAEGDSAAAVENVATEAIEESSTENNLPDTENTPAEAANIGDVSKTKAFSERLNQKVREEKDRFIAELGFTNQYTGEKITTTEAFEKFKQMHEAAQNGRDPLVAAELSGLKQKLQSFTVKEQDAELQNDPVYGEYYKELRPDVLSLLNTCKAKNIETDLKAAFTTVLTSGNNFAKITTRIKENAQKEAIRGVQAASTASVGALGNGADNKPKDINSMSDSEFEALLSRAQRGERFILQ